MFIYNSYIGVNLSLGFNNLLHKLKYVWKYMYVTHTCMTHGQITNMLQLFIDLLFLDIFIFKSNI